MKVIKIDNSRSESVKEIIEYVTELQDQVQHILIVTASTDEGGTVTYHHSEMNVTELLFMVDTAEWLIKSSLFDSAE